MKKTFSLLQQIMPLFCVLCLSFKPAQAATFTAISSGNFSSPATWNGGTVPPLLLNGDNIIIPNGINVAMDQNVTLQSATSLTVNGSLAGLAGKFISMNLASLNGSGSIAVDSFSANFTSGFNYTGNLTAATFYSTNAMVNAAATILVQKTLHLAAGTMTMAMGQLNLSVNATILVKGGTLTITGGMANLTALYNVVYKAFGVSGPELTGSGLNNVTIDMPAGNSTLFLSNNLTLNGKLTLTAGYLALDNHRLTFKTTADLAAAGTGKIISGNGSSIYVHSKNGLSGKLRFYQTGNYTTVRNFLVNTDPGKIVAIDSGCNLDILDTLTLQSGLLDVSSSMLTLVGGPAKMVGGGASSYIVTSRNPISQNSIGLVMIHLDVNDTRTFPIGTLTRYAPCTIKYKQGSPAALFGVNVSNTVRFNGNLGPFISATEPVVDATWSIHPNGTASQIIDLELMWSANMEANSFNRNKSYISRYVSGYDKQSGTPALLNSNGIYSITRTGINGPFTHFAVFDDVTKPSNVHVKNISSMGDIQVYPNPATDRLVIEGAEAGARLTVLNMLGQEVFNGLLNSSKEKIDISQFAPGNYVLQFLGSNGVNSVVKVEKE